MPRKRNCATENEYKAFKEIPFRPKEPFKPVINRERINIYKGKAPEKVVNNEDIKWQPIDRVAARVVAEAPWWALPPEPEPVKNKMRNQFPISGRIKAHRKLMPDSGVVEEVFSQYEVAPLAIMEHENRVKEGIDSADQLVSKAHAVVDACDYLVNHIKEPFAEYQSWVKRELGTVRESRLALESETRQLMLALKEVRTFFLEGDYELERARLAEFISLCERLQRLKDSGFLDTVADTILRLSSQE